MMIIINANIKTMEKENFPNGFIRIRNGKIEQVGGMPDLKWEDDEILDVQGATVLPGLIEDRKSVV